MLRAGRAKNKAKTRSLLSEKGRALFKLEDKIAEGGEKRKRFLFYLFFSLNV